MMQGVHAEVNKRFTRSVTNYIITSRIVQGRQDLGAASEEERADVILRWNNIKFDLKQFYMFKRKQEKSAEKGPAGAEGGESPFSRPKTSWLQKRQLSSEERKRLQTQKRGFVDAPILPPSSSSSAQQSLSEDVEMEQAIQASVQETSKGNAEEDAMIEAAIRESVNAIRQRGALPELVSGKNNDRLEKDPGIFEDDEYKITDEEYQDLIEQAIQKSLASQSEGFYGYDGSNSARDNTVTAAGPDAQESGVMQTDEEHDAELLRAMEASKNAPSVPPRRADDNDDDDADLQKALKASKQEGELETSQRTEEEIVLEYVKKQSLAEEEFRRQQGKGKGQFGGGNEDEHDEELKRAMEESLKISRGDDSGPSGPSRS